MKKTLHQGLMGVIIALISIGIVIGGFSLSMAESSLAPDATQPPVATILELQTTMGIDTATMEPQIIAPTWTASPSASAVVPTLQTATLINTKVTIQTATTIPCTIHPNGWVIYVVKPGDNLYRLSLAYNLKVADLQAANCLKNPDVLSAGQKLYVPNIATITPTQTLIYPMSPSATVEPPTEPAPSETPITPEP